MALPELSPPDVQVIQEFQTVSPTIVTPMLMPCIVAACKQVLNALTSTGSVNSDVAVTLPGYAITTNTSFTGLGGKRIKVQYKTYTAEEITFAASPANPTPDQVVEQFNLAAPTGLLAVKVTDGANERVMFRTTASALGEDFKFLLPAADDGSAILGITKDYTYFGYSQYNQYDIRLPDLLLPDPNDNLSELLVDRTSVRAFVNTSGVRMTEAKRTESIVEPYGKSDITGTVAINGLSYPDDLMDKTFEMLLAEESEKTLTLFATLKALLAAAVTELRAAYTLHIAHGAGAGHQNGADAVNVLDPLLVVTATSTLAEFSASMADFETKYNAHDADVGPAFHGVVGPQFATAGGALVTWANLITAYNDYWSKFNQHIELLAGPYHDLLPPSAVAGEYARRMIIDLYNALASHYTLHIANSAAGVYTLRIHKIPDIVNTLTYPSLGTTATLADIAAAYLDFQAKFNAHDADAATYHIAAGVAHQIAGGAATPTFAEVLDLAYDNAASCFTAFNAHISATDIHYLGGDTYNPVVTTKNLATVDENTVVTEINALWGANVTASLTGANLLKIVSNVGGLTIGDGTANVVMGFTDDDYEWAIEAVDDGDADTLTPYVRVQNADFTAAAAAASHTGSIALSVANFPPVLTGKTVILGEDGAHLQTIVLTAAAVDVATVILEINAVMGSGFCINSGDKLKFDTTITGHEAKLQFGNGTAHRDLGLPVNTAYYGTAFKPVPGDELWQNDARLATIIEVGPGGNVDRLRLDTEITNTYKKAHAWIQAKNIASGAVGRPTPDLTTNNYYFDIKHDLVRDHRGQPSNDGGQLLVTYSALRKDVSPDADNPELLVYETTDDVEDAIPPVDETNPLALGLFFALTNAPNVSVSGIGVTEDSTTYPFGTLQGFVDAFEFLEAYEVYAIAPMTQEIDVHGVLNTHVTSMSLPAQKRERMGIVVPVLPTRKLDTAVVSGTNGESTATLNEFDSKLADLPALIAAQGLNPAALSYSDGVYIDIERDTKKYNVSSVVGTLVTIRVAFGATENTDNFFATTNLPADLLQESFTVYVRGAAISTKTEQVEAYYYLGKSYANRRFVNVVGSQVVASVGGSDTSLAGHYLGAAIAGMVGENHPAQGHTNLPISGFKSVSYTWPYFNDTQLNQIAAGGNYIIIQRTSGGPLLCRHQLTTDVTTVNNRELNILKAVDFSAKFYRLTVKEFVGIYNISPSTYDLLALVVESATEYLKNEQVILGAEFGGPTQSTTQTDKTEINGRLEVYVPNNYIEITLTV